MLKAVNTITLFVEDQQRSKEFYERVFDLPVLDEEEGTVIFRLGETFLRLLTRASAEDELLGKVPVGGSGGASFELTGRVEDVDAVCAELEGRGVPIAFGPVDRPWGVRNAGFRDPDGHVWSFSAPIPAA